MANKIQLRRDTTANWTRVNPILDDGEPGLEIDTNKVKYGDGNTPWISLEYASGGGFTDVLGVVTFPGDLLIGTLWPEDPMPEGDKESVIWAKDDTEYLGMWWGGDQTYPEDGYGPVAGIMIGAYDDMTDDFSEDPSPADTNITFGINDSTGFTNEWRFDRDGNLTLPTGGHIGPGGGKGEGTTLGGANDHFVSVTSYYGNTGLYSSCVTCNADGTLNITAYNDGGPNPAKVWTFDNDGYLTTPGEIIIESDNAHGGAGYAGLLTFSNTVDGSTINKKFVRLNSSGNLEIVDSGYANTIMSLSDGGNLTVKGSINSSAGTGNVTLQASDGSNPRNFVFDTDGSISLPHLASGSQGVGAFNAVNNLIALTSSDTVDFANFSGMILVNTHNGGGVTLYLCGGGATCAAAVGDSRTGNSVGAMAYNSGIGGYTFTADETGNHVFCAIRTRTVA